MISIDEINKLQADNKRLNDIIDSYQPRIQRYKDVLQEIKAIVKNICDGCTSECDCDEDCNYFLITEQLTKAEEEWK